MKKNLDSSHPETYWDDIYTNDLSSIPNYVSSFAKFTIEFLSSNKHHFQNSFDSLLEIACGNCRDFGFLSSYFKHSLAVDISISDEILENHSFITSSGQPALLKKTDIFSLPNENYTSANVIYSRWFLHTMNWEKMVSFFNLIFNLINSNTFCFFEFRSMRDELYKKGIKVENDKHGYYTDHYRRFTDPIDFMDLLNTAFPKIKILFFEELDNVSIIKDSNPTVIRCVLKKSE